MTAPNSNNADQDGRAAREEERIYRYEITGTAAHSRIAKLLPSDWVDCSPYVHAKEQQQHNNTTRADDNADGNNEDQSNRSPAVDFLWSNAPRASTKSYRDAVSAYSHLPNGTAILDDKWVLARLLGGRDARSSDDKDAHDDENAAEVIGLESHCFRGPDGFAKFCDRVGMFAPRDSETDEDCNDQQYAYPELIADENADGTCQPFPSPPPEPANLWVVKDAQSNGAGGIWVVDPSNASNFLPLEPSSANDDPSSPSPLIDNHRYVAQRYAWPPMLYRGRKFHIRVYGLITADGRAYVHQRCFLHVANERFEYCNKGSGDGGIGSDPSSETDAFEPSVHITNCCANSHDEAKFSGEICADLGRCLPKDTSIAYSGNSAATAVPLGDYLPSISATLATLARKSMPYISGGTANGGFEYLGLDFILSPGGVAHLLEVNAPPSQDTATGLPHAEELHDNVIRDLLTLCVLPKVDDTRVSDAGGWRCVYVPDQKGLEDPNKVEDQVLPSKAAIGNKMRWSVFEWKMAKRYEEESKRLRSLRDHDPQHEQRQRIRNAFPYFIRNDGRDDVVPNVFVENAGGTQVPSHVIEAMATSLGNRHRAADGSRAKNAAREALLCILGASSDTHNLFLGPNATSLLDMLAHKYNRSSFVQGGDEIIISAENHLANTAPWERLATDNGATIVWWNPTEALIPLVNSRTRIVAISHASNVVGEIRDVKGMCEIVKDKSNGRAHVVVDGVAAAPHVYADLSKTGAHFYAISCHKLFGPHLGGLCALQTAVADLDEVDDHDSLLRSWELGTANFEACAGVGYGLCQYLTFLSKREADNPRGNTKSIESPRQSSFEQSGEAMPIDSFRSKLTSAIVLSAYQTIKVLENDACNYIVKWLKKSPNTEIVELVGKGSIRIPIVSFYHRQIDSDHIARICLDKGILCRSDKFLAGALLQEHIVKSGCSGGRVVRLSFVHYNTLEEAKLIVKALESIGGW